MFIPFICPPRICGLLCAKHFAEHWSRSNMEYDPCLQGPSQLIRRFEWPLLSKMCYKGAEGTQEATVSYNRVRESS